MAQASLLVADLARWAWQQCIWDQLVGCPPAPAHQALASLQDPERGVTHTTTIFPPDPEAPAVASGSGLEGQGKAEATTGHQVELPVDMVAQRGDMQPGEVYAPMQGEAWFC